MVLAFTGSMAEIESSFVAIPPSSLNFITSLWHSVNRCPLLNLFPFLLVLQSMQLKIIPAVIPIFLFISSFQPLQEQGIKLTITHLRNEKGFVLVSLFKDGAGYPDDAEKAFRREKLAIYNKKAVILFPDLPAGNYAISILQDENNDQRMNKNALGVPKEGYGFSNNVAGAFGPPSFRRASFKHAAGALTQLSIRIRY
ncbi:MAG: DUF2141 domain-containing protein [Bacteroidetes bacterium]|nr:DUF2141 domain-containing protein [Bacteroidota bacterium]